MAYDRPTRRPTDPLRAAEAAFKAATTKPVEMPSTKPAIPGIKQLVSLRLDEEVIEHFQAEGPGWQERINDALKALLAK